MRSISFQGKYAGPVLALPAAPVSYGRIELLKEGLIDLLSCCQLNGASYMITSYCMRHMGLGAVSLLGSMSPRLDGVL